MTKKMNLWSFIFSIICMLFLYLYFFLDGFSSTNIIGLHPLYMILYLTLLTLSAAIIGFSSAKNWKEITRSIATVLITLVLSLFLIFIIFLGSLFLI